MPSAAGHRAAVAGEEDDARQKHASWIQKRAAFSLCVKMGFQCADLVSDVVTPIVYFYTQKSEAADTGAAFLELAVSVLPGASCFITVPQDAALKNATLFFVENLNASSVKDVAARTFAETDSVFQLPTWFSALYMAHALLAMFISFYVVRSGLPYLRHCLKPFWTKAKAGKTSLGKTSTRIAAARTDDEEHGGTKDGVLMEMIETEGLKLAYLKASKLMFWVEDFTGIFLSGGRFVHRCLLTGLTLRTVDQVLMLTQFLFSFAMLGFIVGTMDELTRLGGLQLKRQEKLAAVVKEATTVLDEFAGVRPEGINTVLRVRHTLGKAKLGAHPRDVTGDVMLMRYHKANAPAIVHATEDHAIRLVVAINAGLEERRRQGVNVVRGEILKKDMGFGTIPGASEAMKVWPTNYAMGRRGHDGTFIVFEAWGRVDVRALVDAEASTTTARLEKTQLYRDELLNVLLVESSYRERRILHGLLLVDAGGLTSEHSEMLRFLKTSRSLQRTIYPGLLKECVIANVASAGAAARALRALELPESAIFFDIRRESRRRGSLLAGSFKRPPQDHRVAPTITQNQGNLNAAVEWRDALCLTQDEELQNWDTRTREEELALFNESSDTWTPIRTELDNVNAELRRLEGSRFVLRRFTSLIDARPNALYRAAVESLGTSSDFRFGDRSMLDAQIVAKLDKAHLVGWQMNKLPRGVNDRLFFNLGLVDDNHRLIVTRDVTEYETLVTKACSESEFLATKTYTMGFVFHYSFRFSNDNDGRCCFESVQCFDTKGSLPSMLMNSEKVGVSMAKGFRGMARALSAMVTSQEGHEARDDDDNDQPEIPHAPRPSSVPRTGILHHVDAEILPKFLGGALEIGIHGRCCEGVDHPPVSATLGRTTLLRTFADVSEEEVFGVSMLMEEIGSTVLGTLSPNVGGEIALLRFFRDGESDVTEALRQIKEAWSLRSSEEWGVDEAHEDIRQRRLGFHDIPGHDALQLVWPHNMNLGRDVDDDVVRYERLGSVDVSALLRDFPIESGTMGLVSRGMDVNDEEWRSALEEIAGLSQDGNAYTAGAGLEAWLSQRRSEHAMMIADFTGQSSHASTPGLPDEAWTELSNPVEGVKSEHRLVRSRSKFFEWRHTIELPVRVGEFRPTVGDWFQAFVSELGTPDSAIFGDRSIMDHVELYRIDGENKIIWQASKMPRGVSNRDFVTIVHHDNENHWLMTESIAGGLLEGLVKKCLGFEVGATRSSFVRGAVRFQGFRMLESGPADQRNMGCRMVLFECIDPLGGIPAVMINNTSSVVGRLRAKGVRGIARALKSFLLKNNASRTNTYEMRGKHRASKSSSGRRSTSSKVFSVRDSNGFQVLRSSGTFQSSKSSKSTGPSDAGLFRKNLVYRTELLSMLIDQLSRREHRVVNTMSLYDMRGLTTAHRKAFPYIGMYAVLGSAILHSVNRNVVVSSSALVTTMWTAFSRFLPESSVKKTMFIRMETSNARAKGPHAELRALMHDSVLPVSLGGSARYGDAGNCCSGFGRLESDVSHVFINEDDAALLDTLAASPGAVAAVHGLYQALSRDKSVDLETLLPHVGGVVALIRMHRNTIDTLQRRVRRMLEMRRKLKSEEVCNEITTQGLSFATLPGTADLHAASWQNNDYLGIDKCGDVVAYERWGAINSARLLESFSLERYREWEKFRWEARALMLDTLSRRNKRVVRVVNVIDFKGAGSEHRKLLGYAKVFSAGDAPRAVPSLLNAAYLVGANTIAAGIINAGIAAFFSEYQKRTTQVIRGNAFQHSRDFAERFDRAAMPANVGGELRAGNDGHCCVGVAHTALSSNGRVFD